MLCNDRMRFVWFLCDFELFLLCKAFKLNEIYVYILNIQIYENLLSLLLLKDLSQSSRYSHSKLQIHVGSQKYLIMMMMLLGLKDKRHCK